MTTSVALSWSARAELSEGAILFDPGRSFSLAMAGPGRSRQSRRPGLLITSLNMVRPAFAAVAMSHSASPLYFSCLTLPCYSSSGRYGASELEASAEFGPP
jgi:hypothetical protein